MPESAPGPCPCGRLDAHSKPLPYAQCCGRFIDADLAAPDAESLMRSRYTAHVRGAAHYLRETWHSSTRPADASPTPGAHWLGLQVRTHRLVDESHAQVEFVARWRVGGQAAMRQHERSRFRYEDGRWFYLDGDML